LSSREYRAIAQHYGTRTAKRSGVLLIRHIDDGLVILGRLGASDAASRAFCIHPIVQDGGEPPTDDSHVAALSIEYRDVANAALSSRELRTASEIALSPLVEVNQMWIADKVQNRFDFQRHHLTTHPRAAALDRYFALWLERLEVDDARYAALIDGL
jgi:hypothetical protein